MRGRRAFTLIEVLLVLALLVVLGALAWPMLTRPFATQRLRSAADTVRTEWAAARLEAIKTGRVYVFRYSLDTGEFSVESQVPPEEMVGEGMIEDPENPGLAIDPLELAPKISCLPEGIVFVGGETGLDQRADTVATDVAPTEDRLAIWAEPLLFFPDGTATSAVVMLENQHGAQIELSLRGATGIASVSSVLAGGEP